jgi:peptide deformylase
MDKMSELFEYNTKDLIQPKQQENPVFDLVTENSPALKQVLPEFDFTNPPINPNEFASKLVETCKKHNGYGLSANQCGYSHRVFVMGTGDDYVAFFNPKIIESNGESHIVEACLSFPLLGLRITRPKEIVVEYQDFLGVKHTTRFDGISARCFLHELDHMNGIVYTERAKPLALKFGLDKRQKTMKTFVKNQIKYMNAMKNGKTAN